MYDGILHGMLRATTDSRSNYSQEELEGMSKTIDAILHLSEAVKRLDKKNRFRMPMHGSFARVWIVENATVRGKQIFVNKRSLFIQMECGAIRPIAPKSYTSMSTNPNGLDAEEMSFIARFI